MQFPTPEAREKRERLGELLDRGLVSIQLDPRRPGVVVPERFRAQPALTLNLSRRFRAPDLTLAHDAVRVTLSFGGVRTPCELPWSSIFAMVSGVDDEGFLFTDAIPAELAAHLPTVAAPPGDADAPPETSEATAEPEAGSEAPARPSLRLVE